jgi:Fic family protein
VPLKPPPASFDKLEVFESVSWDGPQCPSRRLLRRWRFRRERHEHRPLAREIANIVRACNELPAAAAEGAVALTADRVCAFNRQVLEGLKVEEDVVPGEIRRHSVTVGRYLGAPAEDCRYLLERLCTWLEGADFAPQPGLEIVYAILKAIVAHVYLAWIHPFGDGNGRTARLTRRAPSTTGSSTRPVDRVEI